MDKGEVRLTPSQERSAEHLWHVWINKRQEANKKNDAPREHDLYEFKSMLEFLGYGHRVIQQAFENKLPTIHQQCSHSQPLPIVNNRLVCALGTEVTSCPILDHLKSTWESETARISPFDGKPSYELPIEALYRTMAKTCAWHIYSLSVQAHHDWNGIDTSEGWMKDESDHMFWSNVYQSLSSNGV